MLHMRMALCREFLFIAFGVFTLLTSCKQDTSTSSEDELAYMADYEAPSDHWGFIDTSGNLIIEADFDDVGAFTEGLAAISKGGKWGYIDRDGNVVIEPVYKSAWAFHEGFARVKPFDKPDQFIDRSGHALAAEDWAASDDFSGGMARVMVGNSFGYVDSSGKLMIQPLFTRGWNFSNDLSVIEYQDKLGIIDRKGNHILQPVYDQIKKAANENIFLCSRENNAIAFDKSGKELLKIPGAKMVDSDGEILSISEGNKMYLIKLSEPEKKSRLYTNIIFLEENLWAGKTDSGYVLLNSAGIPLTENAYNQLNRFSDGFAAYSKGDYWGYINTKGEEVSAAVFGLAWDYRQGFARAAFKDGIAFIDKKQKLAFYPPAGSLDMRDFSEGRAAVMID